MQLAHPGRGGPTPEQWKRIRAAKYAKYGVRGNPVPRAQWKPKPEHIQHQRFLARAIAEQMGTRLSLIDPIQRQQVEALAGTMAMIQALRAKLPIDPDAFNRAVANMTRLMDRLGLSGRHEPEPPATPWEGGDPEAPRADAPGQRGAHSQPPAVASPGPAPSPAPRTPRQGARR